MGSCSDAVLILPQETKRVVQDVEMEMVVVEHARHTRLRCHSGFLRGSMLRYGFLEVAVSS